MAYRDIEARRRNDLERFHRRTQARCAVGLCLRCGKSEPEPERTLCEPCAEKRNAAGLCTKCGTPAFEGLSCCGPCAAIRNAGRSTERKNEAARRRYAERRACGLCTDCGEPSQGAARCEPCARRSYERSTHFRGMPLYPPHYTVVALETGEDLGTWDSWEDVALCLAFSRLSLDQVTVVTDQSPVATLAAWE